jgi:hypothetical protein
MNVAAGVVGFHGAAAVQETGCVACHVPGGPLLLCDLCHRSGAIGGSLHPPGYGLTHPRSEITANAPIDIGGGIALTCLACHPGG